MADAMKYAVRMKCAAAHGDLFHFISEGYFIAKQLHIAPAIYHFIQMGE